MSLIDLTRKHGVRIPPLFGCSVEQISLAVGDLIGHSSVKSAARMNSNVVVFLDCVEAAEVVAETGVEVGELFLPAYALSSPAVTVTVSSVPPFIRNEEIIRELAKHGKVVSPVRRMSSGFKSPLLQHVVSHRRQVRMIPSNRSREVNLVFKITVEDFDYVIFAKTEGFKCYSCGKEGHMSRECRGENGSHEDQNQKGTEEEGRGDKQDGHVGTSGAQEARVEETSVAQEARGGETSVAQEVRGEETSAAQEVRGEAISVAQEVRVEETSAAQEVRGEETSVAQEVRGEETSAAQEVRGEETSVAQEVRGEETSVAQEVRGEETSAAQGVRVEETSAAQEVRGEAISVAQEVRVEETSAAQEVRGEETSVAQEVRGEETSAAQEVRGEETSVAQEVRGEEASAAQEVRGEAISVAQEVRVEGTGVAQEVRVEEGGVAQEVRGEETSGLQGVRKSTGGQVEEGSEVDMEEDEEQLKVPRMKRKKGEHRGNSQAKKVAMTASVGAAESEPSLETDSESSREKDAESNLEKDAAAESGPSKHEAGSRTDSEGYSVEEIQEYLKKSKNVKGARVEDYLSDTEQLSSSARSHMRCKDRGGLTKQEGFRLKKIVQTLRKGMNKDGVK